MLNYGDMMWTTGSVSGGQNGLGGTEAQVGGLNILPTEVALIEHTKRAAYQAGHCWAQSTLKYPKLPSPTDWGWILANESWRPMWTARGCQVMTWVGKCGCQAGHCWAQSTLKDPKLPSPTDWGWILANESWRPMWTARGHGLVSVVAKRTVQFFASVLKQILCVLDYIDVMVNSSLSTQLVLNITRTRTKGFCQVKKNPKIREKLGVGGWVKPQLGLFSSFGKFVFFFSFFLVVHVSKKN